MTFQNRDLFQNPRPTAGTTWFVVRGFAALTQRLVVTLDSPVAECRPTASFNFMGSLDNGGSQGTSTAFATTASGLSLPALTVYLPGA